MIDFEEKAVCRLVARMFEIANKNVILFPLVWLQSALNELVIKQQPAVISQSPLYLLESLEDEIHGLVPSKEEPYPSEEMFWLGYILTYTQFDKGLSGKILAAEYDVKRFLANYETLHTLSSQMASDILVEDFKNINADTKQGR